MTYSNLLLIIPQNDDKKDTIDSSLNVISVEIKSYTNYIATKLVVAQQQSCHYDYLWELIQYIQYQNEHIFVIS